MAISASRIISSGFVIGGFWHNQTNTGCERYFLTGHVVRLIDQSDDLFGNFLNIFLVLKIFQQKNKLIPGNARQSFLSRKSESPYPQHVIQYPGAGKLQ